MVTTVTSVIDPNDYTIFLFVFGIAIEIVIYGLIAVEGYYFERYKLGHHGH